ncbi:MAG: sterol desaturase family protein [Proteobacteria bacterium]|nr:sterol desaturase family protein [Pseudomonadota bacterium]
MSIVFEEGADAITGDGRQRGLATYALTFLLWPAILAACIYGTWLGFESGHSAIYFNITYLLLALSLFALERLLPHEREWLKNDRQMGADLAHTLLSKGFAQVLVIVGLTIGIAEVAASKGGEFWPTHWPLAFQIMLGLVIAEAGLYIAHRVAHEWALLWRFHAVHHSAPRLWFFNTGRFHLVDTVTSILLSQPLLFLAGAPSDVFIWTNSITAFIGMLTHCNIEMRFGPLNYVFNTPAVHRWHHSRNPAEGNSNYGENLMLFDILFRTFYCPNRRPPADIGIDGPMPTNFTGQFAQPFRRDQAALPVTSGGDD